MRNAAALISAFCLVAGNGILDHYCAPSGIDFTPVVLTAMAVIISFGTRRLSPFLMSALTAGCAVINDIMIKLYGGGTHDLEGLAWINLFFIIGLFPAFIVLMVGILRLKSISMRSRIFAFSMFPLLMCLYLTFFGGLGLGRNYDADGNRVAGRKQLLGNIRYG